MTFQNWALVAALSTAAIVAVPVAAVAASGDPAGTLATYNDGIIAIMKAAPPLPARVSRFETLVKSHYDMPGIAALVVGPKWAAAGAGEREAAIAALTRHSAVSLARNFTGYSGEKFVTDPKVANRGTSAIVKVTIASTGGSNVLQYRLRQAGSDWRIIDVVADGVSQLALQRAELSAIVASDGVAGMARKLTARDAALVKS